MTADLNYNKPVMRSWLNDMEYNVDGNYFRVLSVRAPIARDREEKNDGER